MYAALLTLHSLLRWVVLGAAVFALVRAASGLSGRPWDATDRRAGLVFTIAADTQVLFGLLLQFVFSDYTKGLLSNMGAAMKVRADRFWAVEHMTGMLVGLALLHVGTARAKRAEGAAKHKQALIFYGLALLVILASVPWPFLGHGRPWLRLG